MSLADAEAVIKNIIIKIVQGCAMGGQVVSDTLVAFMVNAVVLDPRNGFSVDQTLTKQDVQKIEELCLDKLMEKCSPSLDTIKMQVYFDMNYTSRREFLEEIHQVKESRLSPLSREIADSRVKTREELDALYRKIVTYILLLSGMGSPTDVNTLQEATAALQSIFPQSELGTFMMLLKRDKEQQLNELTMIVTGIQLFNKAIKMGEEETDFHELVPTVINEALPVINKSIESEMSVSQSLAWKYTAVLEKLMESVCQPGECDIPIVLLQQALYNVRQHEAFLRMLLADACLCAKNVEILQRELSLQMKLLKETVQSKTAVPTVKVFPLFKALSKLWCGLQDEAELLNILNNIRLNLQPFLTSQAKIFSEAYLDSLLETSEVKTDEQRMTESSDEHIVPSEMKAQEWLLPDTTAGSNDLPLQYNGICGYMLVNRNGLLLPDDFIAEIAERAKISPELIHLLKLQQFSSISPYCMPGSSVLVRHVTKCESSTQTDIHPLETNVVNSYEWNEWELRRKAIKLADLLTKVTKSSQTELSHMRRENVTQTWLLKNVACQSKRDGESNTPKPQMYLAHLRGRRDGHVVKTNLARSVDE
uniref:cilia- and flagella-associated protein 206 isoform X2 n=1 Tax=Monopterus albus TaxID=43700 RepID=UPI0009B33A15|nr:cilia- and flagella-associated protein 206 isoform X2 [Monopterus albus]